MNSVNFLAVKTNEAAARKKIHLIWFIYVHLMNVNTTCVCSLLHRHQEACISLETIRKSILDLKPNFILSRFSLLIFVIAINSHGLNAFFLLSMSSFTVCLVDVLFISFWVIRWESIYAFFCLTINNNIGVLSSFTLNIFPHSLVACVHM